MVYTYFKSFYARKEKEFTYNFTLFNIPTLFYWQFNLKNDSWIFLKIVLKRFDFEMTNENYSLNQVQSLQQLILYNYIIKSNAFVNKQS